MSGQTHNAGNFDGVRLYEQVTTVIQLKGERIERLDTYITDVEMLDRYFGAA